jgi:PAS domain S-box-containing protein
MNFKNLPAPGLFASSNSGNRISVFIPIRLIIIIILFFSAPARSRQYNLPGIDSLNVISDDNYPPYVFRNESGELQGIVVDEWKLWEAKTGIRVHLTAHDWAQTYQMMLDGKADVLETVFYRPERAKLFSFTQPYAKVDVPVFFHKSLSGINSVQSLRGFTIGVKAGDACVDILKQQGITTLKEFSSYEAIIKAAGNGDVRVFCMDEPPAMYFLYKYNLSNYFNYAFTLYSGEFHRAVKNTRPDIIQIVENGFSLISQNELEQIEQKWTGVPIDQPHYIQYIIYSFFAIALVVLFLVIINILLRRKVDEKTKALEIAFSELMSSEEKYREICETANEGIFTTDNTGLITSVNMKFAEMTGYQADELLGVSYKKLLIPDEQNFPQDFLLARTQNNHDLLERYLLRKDGEKIFTLISKTRLEDTAGNFQGTIGLVTDITERKTFEENLRKFYLGVEQSPASIIVVDVDGKIDYINQKFMQTTGYTREDFALHGSTGESLLTQYIMQNRTFWELLLAGNEWSGEINSCHKSGQNYWESALISPVRNEKGELTHVIALKEDISEKRKMIEDLIAAKEKAEEMSRLKSSFLANMSHELRTPLVGILGFSEILGTMLDDPELKHIADNINKGGRRLSDTLNMILDLSKVESNSMDFSPEPVDLVSLTADIFNSYSAAAQNKNLSLNLTVPEKQIFAALDIRLIQSVLNNLINNAIKYTRTGGVNVKVFEESIDSIDWAVVQVEDSGIGIDEKNLDLIFEEFRQASEGFGRSFEGTGLGLTITRKATEMMHGKISVTSQLGVGSVFTVRFPEIAVN